MLSLIASVGKKWRCVKLGFHLVVSGAVIVLSVMLFICPAITILQLVFDSRLKDVGESRLAPAWFQSAAGRYLSWANSYLDTNYAASLHHDDIAPTEWPMFGSVFFLVTAEDLQRQGQVDATRGTVRQAVEKAAQIVASPVTATWVRAKWGDRYLTQENVFYRMLLIMGLSSYENITGNSQYHSLMSTQRITLANELSKAKYHLRNDYPNECYPGDMLWAVAAIQRAGRLDNVRHDELVKGLVASFDGPLKSPEGLPAFQVDARTGQIIQDARGCGNSGILLFAAELDPEVASRWYRDYERNFWKDTGWIVGFTEMPRDLGRSWVDVDSGPTLCGIGSVATAFGIGAARSVGRIDHAAPLTMEAIAGSWPTPFGFLIPGLMGHVAVKSWSLGEVALLFSMTRPTCVADRVPFAGRTPPMVWLLLAVYIGAALLFIGLEIRSCRRLIRSYRSANGMVAGAQLHHPQPAGRMSYSGTVFLLP